MRIQWIGQCCFMLTGEHGPRVLMDPFRRDVGLPRGEFPADVVTFSHRHLDHYDASAVPKGATVVEGPGAHRCKGLEFHGLQAFHDEQEGLLRGQVTLFRFKLDGFSVVHLADLGHPLNEYARRQLAPIDVLLIPMGGKVTLDPRGAREVIELLAPRIAVPMAYHLPGLIMGALSREKVEKAYPIHTSSRFLDLPAGARLPRRTEVRFLEAVPEYAPPPAARVGGVPVRPEDL